jgi:hypothetical protein
VRWRSCRSSCAQALEFLNSPSRVCICAGDRGTVSGQGEGCRRLSSSVVAGRPRTAHRRPGPPGSGWAHEGLRLGVRRICRTAIPIRGAHGSGGCLGPGERRRSWP